jgi:hypothetical protein
MNIKVSYKDDIQDNLIMNERGSNGTGVILDHTLAASRARISPEVRRILTSILKEALVVVFHEYFYRVNFSLDVYPSIHIVTHNLYCSCPLEHDCPAVTAVKVYLQRGIGEIARTPNPGFFPALPHYCPICGARACYDPELSSHHRGVGWQCSQHGTSHYWKYQGSLPRVAYLDKPVSK